MGDVFVLGNFLVGLKKEKCGVVCSCKGFVTNRPGGWSVRWETSQNLDVN